MDPNEIFNNALNSKYIIIDENELKTILDNCEIVRVEDTHLSDFVRVLKHKDKLFVQERLDYYERKWDGCGCKIDYYE